MATKPLSKQLGTPQVTIHLLFGEDKYTKAEADYREADSETVRCGECDHMEGDSACELVSGRIEPDMVCDYFEGEK